MGFSKTATPSHKNLSEILSKAKTIQFVGLWA